MFLVCFLHLSLDYVLTVYFTFSTQTLLYIMLFTKVKDTASHLKSLDLIIRFVSSCIAQIALHTRMHCRIALIEYKYLNEIFKTPFLSTGNFYFYHHSSPVSAHIAGK